MILEFTVPGEPIGKQRPRVTKRGITYTPAKTVHYGNLVKMSFCQKYPVFVPMKGEIWLECRVYKSIPSGTSVKKVAKMELGEIRPIKKPDWDNVGKLISDALEKVAYERDSMVVSGHVEKWYSARPRVEVTIKTL